METNIIALMKASIGGAGAGFAMTGCLSFLAPTFTVTASLAFTFAVLGGVLTAAIYLKNSLVA